MIPTERQALAELVTAAEDVLNYFSGEEDGPLRRLTAARRAGQAALDGIDYDVADWTNGHIRAEVHTDNHWAKTTFNAVPWFEQASEDEIEELARCGWGGDYPADTVAYFMEDLDSDVRAVLSMTGNGVGFECYVNAQDALLWLKEHRPGPYLAALEPDEEEDLG